jgi:hypothetical protein
MIPTTIKSKVVLAAISAVKDTANARKEFRYWPNYFKADPTWGLKIDQETIQDISDLVTSPRTLRELYDERVEQNCNAYKQAHKTKPTQQSQPKTNTAPKQNKKPDIDLDDDDDDYLDSLHDLIDDDNEQLVIPKQPQQSAPVKPQPQPQNTNNHSTDSNDYILNKASLYPKGSTVYWPSKRWGKLGFISGKVIGKKPGTVSDFLVIETEDGRVIDIDPEITQVRNKKPSIAQRLSTAIMGESIEQFLKS